jgi:hypothetical protein
MLAGCDQLSVESLKAIQGSNFGHGELLCCAVLNTSQCLPLRFRRIGLAALKSMWGAAVVLVGPAEKDADAVELLGAGKLSRTVCTQIWRQRGWPSTVAPGAGFVRLSAALLGPSPIIEPLNVDLDHKWPELQLRTDRGVPGTCKRSCIGALSTPTPSCLPACLPDLTSHSCTALFHIMDFRTENTTRPNPLHNI